MNMNMTELTKVLDDLQRDSEYELINVVIEDLLYEEFETVEEVSEFLESIFIYGTDTGVVPRLVYRSNIRSLFFEYGEDIVNIAIDREIKLSDFRNFDEFIDIAVRIAYETEAFNLSEFIKTGLPQAN